jgi:hypothetical protein
MGRGKRTKHRRNMSISSEVKDDIKVARKLWLPWWGVLAWMAFCLPVILLTDHFSRLNMSLPLLNCIGVFGFLIYLKWELRQRPWFWITLALLVMLHVVLIWFIPWTSKWVPALAIAAISSVDFCMMLWILAAVASMTGPKTLVGPNTG